MSSKSNVRMRCRYRYLCGKSLYSLIHCQPVKQRNRRVASIRLRNSSESAGLPFQFESLADGMGESIRRMHVDGADYVHEIAPDSTRRSWMMLACADSSIDARESVAVTVALSKSDSRGENSREGVVESHHYGRDHERHCA